MPARKIRVQLFDESGDKYTITFEGSVTRDKAIRLLDLVELLGGMSELSGPRWDSRLSGKTKIEKLQLIIERYFPIVWFSSKDVRSTYEKELNEPISLSAVSTYLSRLTDRGFIIKTVARNKRRYRVVTEITKFAGTS
jgi:DNA-binding transcriptional ArsR family regulator